VKAETLQNILNVFTSLMTTRRRRRYSATAETGTVRRDGWDLAMEWLDADALNACATSFVLHSQPHYSTCHTDIAVTWPPTGAVTKLDAIWRCNQLSLTIKLSCDRNTSRNLSRAFDARRSLTLTKTKRKRNQMSFWRCLWAKRELHYFDLLWTCCRTCCMACCTVQPIFNE